MAFTAKFGADGKGPADDVASSEWSDETSKALRDAGFKSECARLPIRGTVITEIGWHRGHREGAIVVEQNKYIC